MTANTRFSIRLHPQDTVAIALKDLTAGTHLPEQGVTLTEAVPRGHKLALAPLAEGAQVIRYGQIIGVATAAIPAGAHVHSHNLGMGPHSTDYAHASASVPLPPVTEARTFMGYHRADGTVGTRNYIGVLTSGELFRFCGALHRRGGGEDRLAGRVRECRRGGAHRAWHRLRDVGQGRGL
jgi:altronate dehydratase